MRAGKHPSFGRRSPAEIDLPVAQPALRLLELVDHYPAGAQGLAKLRAELEAAMAASAVSAATNVEALLKAAAPFLPSLCVICSDQMGKNRLSPRCTHFICDDTGCVQGFCVGIAFHPCCTLIVLCS